jgi:hypothetical protein
VGSYWTRTNNPEIDIVIADRAPVAKSVYAVGSIKWKDNQAFSPADLNALLTHRTQLPGATANTPLVVVTRAGYAAAKLDDLRVLEPEELLSAWT